MYPKKIPCCYFPTTTIFADDQMSFLKSLVLSLDRRLSYQLFNNPKKALELLKKGSYLNKLLDKWLLSLKDTEFDDDRTAHSLIDINISEIYKEIYNSKRFSEISTVVVDYAMPGIDGLEFCRRLQNSAIKKLMLTGQASTVQAVEAFNAGEIHKFFFKDDLDTTKLNSAIKELKVQFFQDLSSPILQNLSREPGYCLADTALIKLFYDICEKNHIIEFYLVNSTGSFLMLDFEGNPSWLVIHTEESLNNYYEYATTDDVPQDIIYALKNREKIPFFFTEKDEELAPHQWQDYLHKATSLIGEYQYYYAYFKGQSVYDIEPNKVFSYKNYLSRL